MTKYLLFNTLLLFVHISTFSSFLALALFLRHFCNILSSFWERMVTTVETRTENDHQNQLKNDNLIILLTQLNSREDHASHQHIQHILLPHHKLEVESPPQVYWFCFLARIGGVGRSWYHWTWWVSSSYRHACGPSHPSHHCTGDEYHNEDMETGIFLIYLEGEVGKRAGTTLYERQDAMASVSTGSERLKIMLTVRVVTLTR